MNIYEPGKHERTNRFDMQNSRLLHEQSILANRVHNCQSRDASTFQCPGVRVAMFLALAMLAMLPGRNAQCESMTSISVDGIFSDWSSVPTHTDPNGGLGVFHNGIPDVHDTNHGTLGGVPSFKSHPDVDIIEYKFTHDENNLYAYFKSTGIIGRTATGAQGKGRYYVIVTIDVDNDDSTGYFLHEGGYYPTSGVERYDMNMEAEFYDGQLNTVHYLSHDAPNVNGLQSDFSDLTSGAYLPVINTVKDRIDDSEISANAGPYTPGFAEPQDGTYDEYTQWVYQENSPATDADDTITLVVDKGPVVPSIMSVALSANGHELEIAAPFKGFMKDSQGNPNMALGKMLDISFSLEASGELAPGGDWASDTADPINGYFLASIAGDYNFDGSVNAADYTVWLDSLGQTGSGLAADGSGNSVVDQADYSVWKTNFGSTTGSGTTASAVVPEPGSAMLLISVMVTAASWRGRTTFSR